MAVSLGITSDDACVKCGDMPIVLGITGLLAHRTPTYVQGQGLRFRCDTCGYMWFVPTLDGDK